jgi:hypothetical protein
MHGIVDRDHPALDSDGTAGIGREHTGKDFHQGALTGAVFAADACTSPCEIRRLTLSSALTPWKCFRDLPHFQIRFHGVRPVCLLQIAGLSNSERCSAQLLTGCRIGLIHPSSILPNRLDPNRVRRRRRGRLGGDAQQIRSAPPPRVPMEPSTETEIQSFRGINRVFVSLKYKGGLQVTSTGCISRKGYAK